MDKKKQTIKYLIFDFASASIAWALFFLYRKEVIEPLKYGYDIPINLDLKFYFGIVLVPLFWLLIYYISGYYKNVYRKSRLIELGQTLTNTFIGVLIIFFTSILDDTVLSYTNYYNLFFVLFGIHFTLTYIPRIIITSSFIHKIHNKEIGFNTLLVGSNKKAVQLYKDIENQEKSTGNIIVGFVNVNDKSTYLLSKYTKHLGSIASLKSIIDKHKITEVIIAIESAEHNEIKNIINVLQDRRAIVKVIPDMYDILTGSVKMSAIYGTPLIQISHDIMPAWQQSLKRIIDVVCSFFAIIILSPLLLFLMIGVKLSSKGPIFYSHERIGRYGKPFTIYKFRSMFTDAEKTGPALSSKNDSRITKFGLFMRKSRLDELPQFYNVIKGEMALVGPRPERQYFIDQIIEVAPHYTHLQKVRPGITSWGQVKYGYAENVEQMIARLKYDIIYIENMSLYVDFKILIYTVKIVLQRSGK